MLVCKFRTLFKHEGTHGAGVGVLRGTRMVVFFYPIRLIFMHTLNHTAGSESLPACFPVWVLFVGSEVS